MWPRSLLADSIHAFTTLKIEFPGARFCGDPILGHNCCAEDTARLMTSRGLTLLLIPSPLNTGSHSTWRSCSAIIYNVTKVLFVTTSCLSDLSVNPLTSLSPLFPLRDSQKHNHAGFRLWNSTRRIQRQRRARVVPRVCWESPKFTVSRLWCKSTKLGLPSVRWESCKLGLQWPWPRGGNNALLSVQSKFPSGNDSGREDKARHCT